MKTLRLIALFFILLGSLFVGYQAGFLAAPQPTTVVKSPAGVQLETMAAQAAPLPSPAPTQVMLLPTGQRNVLVVGVDDLKSERPQLESVWLVIGVPPDSHLTLLPVFPTTSGSVERDEQLVKAFSLNPKSNPVLNMEFIRILQSREIFWNGDIILDRFALARALDYLTAGAKNSTTVAYLDGDIWVNKLAQAGDKPQIAVSGQANFYQELCWRASRTDRQLNEAALKELSNLVAGHTLVELNLVQAMTEIGMFNASPNLYCDFPTLASQTLLIH